MKKLVIVMVSVVALTLFAFPAAAQEYDKAAVVEAMRAIGAAMQTINQAMEEDDFYTIGASLMDIAVNMKAMDEQTPKKGSKDEWDAIHSDLIKAAFKGIGACGEEDMDMVKKYFDEVKALNKKGHGAFK